MKTQAYLPVGTKETKKTILIKKGDVIKLATGEECTFMEIKRTKFIGTINGKSFNIPVWRDRLQTTPFITEKTKKTDKQAVVKSADPLKFQPGQIFTLEGHKETFMFSHINTKRGGRKEIKALDIATQKTFNIGLTGFIFVKTDVNKMKREIKAKLIIENKIILNGKNK